MDLSVSEVQTSYIKGQQFHDSYLSAAKILSYCKYSKKRGWIYELDFEKKIDNVLTKIL